MSKHSKKSPAETRELIRSFCGVFNLKPGEKSAVQEHLEDRRAEEELEERKWQRFEQSRRKRN